MKVYVTANGRSAELTNEHVTARKDAPILIVDGLAYDPGDAYLEGVVVDGPEENPLVLRWRDRTRMLFNGMGAVCQQCGHTWLNRGDQLAFCPYCGAES